MIDVPSPWSWQLQLALAYLNHSATTAILWGVTSKLQCKQRFYIPILQSDIHHCPSPKQYPQPTLYVSGPVWCPGFDVSVLLTLTSHTPLAAAVKSTSRASWAFSAVDMMNLVCNFLLATNCTHNHQYCWCQTQKTSASCVWQLKQWNHNQWVIIGELRIVRMRKDSAGSEFVLRPQIYLFIYWRIRSLSGDEAVVQV